MLFKGLLKKIVFVPGMTNAEQLARLFCMQHEVREGAYRLDIMIARKAEKRQL